MDISQLVKELVPFLAPFLPYLLKAGEKATEEAGRRLGAAAWEQAQALWARLRPQVEARPAAQVATLGHIQHPATFDKWPLSGYTLNAPFQIKTPSAVVRAPTEGPSPRQR